jgi:hypothetical protein
LSLFVGAGMATPLPPDFDSWGCQEPQCRRGKICVSGYLAGLRVGGQ